MDLSKLTVLIVDDVAENIKIANGDTANYWM